MSQSVSVNPQALAPKELPVANRGRGLALALLVIPVGIVLWDVIWSLGFIASIVAFAISAGAVWLYRLGAKAQPGRLAALALLGIILVAIMLSFISGMVTDIAAFYADDQKVAMSSLWGNAEFWDIAISNVLFNGELWGQYAGDLAISLGLAALGAFSVVRDLVRRPVKVDATQ